MGAGAAVADAVSLMSVFSFRFLFVVRRFFRRGSSRVWDYPNKQKHPAAA
jgi:hypothetical protein